MHLGSAPLADDRLTVTLNDVSAYVALVVARAIDAVVGRHKALGTLARTAYEGCHDD